MQQHHNNPDARALAHWLLRLEALRYAPAAAVGHTARRRQLATLQREFKHLRWGT